ncbi:Putative unusual protein kinase [Gloeomargarita lithophora Alchichica-D10]|uniref:Unusual protein kinase n=2 Tax=Gloeomargarita TaxID=1188227 RepID=A0A1J0A915_9CYAN|nr:AarF/ABC1/UbiB kinase family protein [Gloeomargarita lithophora]APB32415.1 Putative unusual protein kinase [Gloeomargarita lithophora Alchichica-D10]
MATGLLPGTVTPAGAQQYDPQAIAQVYDAQPRRVWRRAVAILWPLLTFVLGLFTDRFTGRLAVNEVRRAQQFRQLLTDLGPAAIKIGQALSTRPDLVPPTYLEELTFLQDQLPPFANGVAYQFIEEELGRPPQQIFAELSPQPVAAASLGQVYKGRLPSGEVVAVKVQRPGLVEQISLDIYILRHLMAWVKGRFKRIRSDLVGILDEFAARLYEEMDYTQEGLNAEKFAQLYGHISDIYIPKIYWNFSGRRVLTMEWITGIKLTDVQKMAQAGLDTKQMVGIGVQCSLRQLLEHGFFHADPHPGNLLAMLNGQLAYLDFGMMSYVNPQQRYGLITAIVHMVNRDYESLAQDYVELGFLTPETDLTPIKPALNQVFTEILGPAGALAASVSQLNIKNITDKLSQMMYEYPFQVPAYYALIIRSLVTLEGIAITIDPHFKVLNLAYPYVAKRLLTDPAPELRQSLKDLLFKDGTFRWNRLENLIKNAAHSGDFDLEKVMAQVGDFLFSERGSFIREKLAEELALGLDQWGHNTWLQFLPNGHKVPTAPTSWEHLRSLWGILQGVPGFEPRRFLPLVSQMVFRPETSQFAQHVARRWSERFLSRWLRGLVLNGSSPRLLLSPP